MTRFEIDDKIKNSFRNFNFISQSCVQIIECLNKGDFGRFIQHLQGLMMIYDLKGSQIIPAPQKSMAWNSLSVLERDLEMVYASYR